VREIGENFVGFFSVLGDWARAERQESSPPSVDEDPDKNRGSQARPLRRTREPRRSG
jgi:hypothetical protein